jgi:transglutaminase-like putative cysteine protease
MTQTLQASYFMDYDAPEVLAFAQKHTTNCTSDREKAVALYYAVRDGFWYNPYDLNFNKTGLKASNLVTRTSGYCVEKSNLMAACARAVGIPSRLSFYDVKNHIATEKLERILQTNVLVFHGAAEVWIDGRWLKITPVFNKALCQKLGVQPLEFDGESDAIFQAYTAEGAAFMEYIHDYGAFDEIPYDLMMASIAKAYPQIQPLLDRGDLHLKLM